MKLLKKKTLVVGIDVGSETHYERAFDWRGYEYSKKTFSFSSTEAGFISFLEWMQNIAKDHGKEELMPSMEPTGLQDGSAFIFQRIKTFMGKVIPKAD